MERGIPSNFAKLAVNLLRTGLCIESDIPHFNKTRIVGDRSGPERKKLRIIKILQHPVAGFFSFENLRRQHPHITINGIKIP